MGHDWGAVATEGGDWGAWICPEDIGQVKNSWCRAMSAHLLPGAISSTFSKCLRTANRSIFHVLATQGKEKTENVTLCFLLRN